MTSPALQRLQSMDALKFFAIFLVLWGHCVQYLISGEFADKPVYRHIYSFHMPLFMMLSGFFFAMTCRRGFWKLSVKKFRQLLLPVLCWILIFTIARRTTMGLPSLGELKGAYLSGLWFLKSAFVCSIIGYFAFVTMRRHMIWGGVISLVVSQLINSPLLQISYMYPCFLAGGVLWINYDAFKKHIGRIAIVTGAIFISANIFLDSYVYSTAKDAFDSLDLMTTDAIRFIGWRVYRLVMGICGGVFLIALTEFIFSKPRSGRLDRHHVGMGQDDIGNLHPAIIHS